MYHNRMHAQHLQQHHILCERLLQRRFGHCVAAILDHKNLAAVLANERRGVNQRIGRKS